MDAIDAEDTKRVLERVQALPELTRQVVTLRKKYGCNQEDISRRLNITPEQVMDELSKAVRAFADMGEVADDDQQDS